MKIANIVYISFVMLAACGLQAVTSRLKIHNYTQYTMVAYSVRTDSDDLVKDPGSTILILPAGQSGWLEVGPGVSGTNRDVVVQLLIRGVDYAALEQFLRKAPKPLSRVSQYWTKRNVGSLIRELFVGIDLKKDQLDTYLTRATAKLLGGVRKPAAVLAKEIAPELIVNAQKAWSAYYKKYDPSSWNAFQQALMRLLITKEEEPIVALAAAIDAAGADQWNEKYKKQFSRQIERFKNDKDSYNKLQAILKAHDEEIAKGTAGSPGVAAAQGSSQAGSGGAGSGMKYILDDQKGRDGLNHPCYRAVQVSAMRPGEYGVDTPTQGIGFCK